MIVGAGAILILAPAVCAPVANAGHIADVQEICASLEGYQPYDVGGTVKCGTSPTQAFWGGIPIARNKGLDLPPGSYRLDPGNPWSDWYVADPGEQPEPPMIGCDRTHCGPDVVLPCMTPTSPCG